MGSKARLGAGCPRPSIRANPGWLLKVLLRMTSPRVMDSLNASDCPMHRPTGVTIIAAICFLNAAYIGTVGVLSGHGAIPVYFGAELSRQLLIGWPYLPLAFGMAWALVGWGLLRLHNWARWTLMLTASWGLAIGLSRAIVYRVHSGRTLLQMAVSAALVWYLFRMPIADQFRKPPGTTSASL
jgi:hypothetical protein